MYYSTHTVHQILLTSKYTTSINNIVFIVWSAVCIFQKRKTSVLYLESEHNIGDAEVLLVRSLLIFLSPYQITTFQHTNYTYLKPYIIIVNIQLPVIIVKRYFVRGL